MQPDTLTSPVAFDDPSSERRFALRDNNRADATQATTPSENGTFRVRLAPPGHWHFAHPKRLTFTVDDGSGDAVRALAPIVVVRAPNGETTQLAITNHDDGTYSADFTPTEIGAEAAAAYAVRFSAAGPDGQITDAWPIEIVRDGLEGIFKADGRYLYQIRYAWVPGQPRASLDQAVDLYFEPRRAIEEGEALERQQPWRNRCDYLTDLTATIVVCSDDQQIRDELPTRYLGLGKYHARRIFSPSEVGAERSYQVSFQFADPTTAQVIGPADNRFSLRVQS